jgi:hypothetical protein
MKDSRFAAPRSQRSLSAGEQQKLGEAQSFCWKVHNRRVSPLRRIPAIVSFLNPPRSERVVLQPLGDIDFGTPAVQLVRVADDPAWFVSSIEPPIYRSLPPAEAPDQGELVV